MGTDSTKKVEAVSNIYSFKVHCRMCTELMKLVDRVLEILPEIEAARPGSPEGREALCNLNIGMKKAELVLQYCRDSSKLYLALTGDRIISRCHRVKSLLEHNLRKIKYMVPVALARKISQIADDLKIAKFILDSSEEEVWKAMQQLLKLGPSSPDAPEISEIKALKIAALRLNILSYKEMLFERRSIRKLLDDVGHGNPRKRKILTYLFYRLKKYGKLILQEISEARADISSSNGYGEMEGNVRQGNDTPQADMILNRAIPPEEFKCPISLRLMYDPVVVESKVTYEKVRIEKWFKEGHDTCPLTKMKLTNFSMTPNVDMKKLIHKWCIKFRVTIPDPSVEPECPEVWENSIASFGSSMNEIRLPIDFSDISFGGLHNSYYPDSLRLNELGIKSRQSKDDDLGRFQSDSNAEETNLEFPSTMSELSWESKSKVIKDMNDVINKNRFGPILSETVMDQLALFIKDAFDLQDSEAQKNGSELFLSLVRKSRSNSLSVPEKILTTLASLLNSEVTDEVLAILEALSGHHKCGSKFITSGVLASMVEYLDLEIKALQEFAVKTFANLSSNSHIRSDIVSLGCIPKLVSLLNDEDDLSEKCMFILQNLCQTEEGKIYIVETNGCIASIVRRLEMGKLENQEHAITILLSLCSQRVEYCELVMAEGVFPLLWKISNNGSEKGKAGAFELHRLLKDVQDKEQQESYVSDTSSSNKPACNSKQRKVSKKPGFLGMIFTKHRPPKDVQDNELQESYVSDPSFSNKPACNSKQRKVSKKPGFLGMIFTKHRPPKDVQDNEQQESYVSDPSFSNKPACNSKQRKVSKKPGFLGMIFTKHRPPKDVQDNEQQESYVSDPSFSNKPACNSKQRKPSKKPGFLGMMFKKHRLTKDVQDNEEQDSYVSDPSFSNNPACSSKQRKPSKMSGFLGLIFPKRSLLKKE
ncbi:U-box domain-containing protein 5-like [Cucurbita maxima]|uniref:RING-type E3 ubiquitin transferase n=1 Tax=Cucurbita maxima TaxID=3661 RepID=A0A6J1IRZ1_CUCMA|nr:U-box domain-containing protein 5-like [Cucurbita maxima]XP_022979015.1 U-box domain-containing protein 5-like [Cucurbita maxima]